MHFRNQKDTISGASFEKLTQVICSVAVMLCLISCSGGSESESATPVNLSLNFLPPGKNTPVPDNRFAESYSILIFGNSHISGLGYRLEKIIESEGIATELHIDSLGGGFLDSPSSLATRQQRLKSRE